MRASVGALLAAALAACAGYPASPSPTPLDCPDIPAGTGFRAGFGRRDLTTPPGPGLFGYGPEGRAAAGYRQRIQSRALVLEDRRGERIALVAVDLGMVSGALHRAAADLIARCTGLGADRLVLSATHTHAAPGHYAAHGAYDRFGSSLPGYDPAMLRFFAEEISRSVFAAMAGMRPARAGWGVRPVWGLTRIRSWAAHASEEHPWPTSFVPPAGLAEDARHVDPTFALLRIDTIGPGGPAPAGAYGIFSVHGTGNPASNDLVDSDLFGGPQRALERHIDALNGSSPRFRRSAVFALVNGAEGDVVGTRDTTGCHAPVLRRGRRPGDFRSPPPPDVWTVSPKLQAACLAQAREASSLFTEKLGAEAVLLFDSVGRTMDAETEVAVAFESVSLRGELAIAGLCHRGRTGTAAVGGAELGRTRVAGWRLGGIYGLGIEEGGAAVRPGNDCQSPKRTLPTLLEDLFAGRHAFEEAAQFSIVRLGPMLLATVPFEPTTTAAARMRDAVREAAVQSADPPRLFSVVALSNGYLQYVTTPAEYARQYYEGASTLYGPASANAYTARLVGLAGRLASLDWRSPPAHVPPFPTFPDKPHTLLPVRRSPDATRRRVVKEVACAEDGAVLRWLDAPPGELFPADGQVVAIDRDTQAQWREWAWDDDPLVEVRVLRRERAASLWEARWTFDGADGTYRFRLTPRGHLHEQTSAPFRIANGACVR